MTTGERIAVGGGTGNEVALDRLVGSKHSRSGVSIGVVPGATEESEAVAREVTPTLIYQDARMFLLSDCLDIIADPGKERQGCSMAIQRVRSQKGKASTSEKESRSGHLLQHPLDPAILHRLADVLWEDFLAVV